MKLSSDMKHKMAVHRILMAYSWHNIVPEYENNTIKYSVDGGINRETVNSVNGMYSCNDLDDFIHEYSVTNKNTKHKHSYTNYGINKPEKTRSN